MVLHLLALHYSEAWDLWALSLSSPFLSLRGRLKEVIKMKHMSIMVFRNIPYPFSRDTSNSPWNVQPIRMLNLLISDSFHWGGNEHRLRVGGGSLIFPLWKFTEMLSPLSLRLLKSLKSDSSFLCPRALKRYVSSGPLNICQCWLGILVPVSTQLPSPKWELWSLHRFIRKMN